MANKQNIPVTLLQCNEGQIEGLPRNPRFIKDDRFKKLVKSLEDDPEMLDLRELIVYPHGKKYVVIGGNMRLRAGKELGFETMPCKILPADTPIEKLKAYVIKDNNAFGNDDFDLLANEWDAEFLEECGFDFGTFYDSEAEGGADNAERKGAEAKAEEDNFDEDTEPIVCRCKRGEVWQLGEHRVMCGDSTSAEDVEKLRGGVLADMVFTDPPYGNNLGYGRGQLGERKIKNDENVDVLYKVVPQMDKALKNNTHCLMWIQWRTFSELAKAMEKYKLRTVVIWDKMQAGLSGGGFAEQYEMLCVFIKGQATQNYYCGNVWQAPRVGGAREDVPHPNMKPISIIAKALELCGAENNYVLDLFGGSGSTLIACEQLNRKCLLMELDPHYCDVILARWEKLTGKTAVKIAD